MKIFSSILLGVLFTTLVLSSCSDDETYAEQLKAEKTLIASYVKRDSINVITKLPKYNAWNEKDFYFSSNSGLYFHLSNPGDTTQKADTLKPNDVVSVRFIQYTLDENPDTIFSWTTIDSPYPITFNYLDFTKACTAWHEAVKYMNRNESEARIIVPSKIGYESYMNTVTPLCYDLKIMIQKY